MHFLELNDDVLQLICNHLNGRHALSLALVSRRLHEFARIRIVAVFKTFGPRTLRAFHRYVLHGPRPLVHYIESIDLGCLSLYQDEDVEDAATLDDTNAPFDEAAVQLVIDLLQKTLNLRRLVLNPRGYILAQCHNFDDLAAALTSNALHRLQIVELSWVNSTIVEVLGRTHWDLRDLSISYQEGRGGPDRVSFRVLLDALANFPNLHSLDISMASFRDWQEYQFTTTRRTDHCYPSIRRLYFSYMDALPALALIHRCPNAKLVTLDPAGTRSAGKVRKIGSTMPFAMVPSLHSLSADIDVLYIASCMDPLPLVELSAVYHWRTPRLYRVVHADEEHEQQAATLLYVLQKLCPVWVQLWLMTGDAPMGFWKEVPLRAPRLRYLDLTISINERKEEYATCLVCISSQA